MKRLVPFLAAIALLMVPSVASAHTASADLVCLSQPILTVDLTNYNGAHVVIAADHKVIVDQDFDSQFHTSRDLGSPLVGHVATVTVTAQDSAQYDRTFDLSSPPCRVVHGRVSARIVGPCGDPKYGFVLRNPTGALVTFRAVVHMYPLGTLRVIVFDVPRRSTMRTGHYHVLGGTRIRVTAQHRVLAATVSAAAGTYGPCVR